jgi:hypothetical protein
VIQIAQLTLFNLTNLFQIEHGSMDIVGMATNGMTHSALETETLGHLPMINNTN